MNADKTQQRTTSTTDQLKLTSIGRSTWKCENLTKGTSYDVSLRDGQYTCSCPSRTPCKHIALAEQEFMSQLSSIHPEGLKTKGFRRSILEILKDFQVQIPDRFGVVA